MVANMKAKSVSFQEMYIKEVSKCPKRSPVKDELSDNYTVPNIAHIEAWQQFYSSQKDCPRSTLLVFQHDACIGVSDAGEIVSQHLSTMTEDIMYFGFCFKSFGIPKFLKRKRFIKYHPKATGLAPHCLHAYAVTVAGASKLLELVKECGPPADHQIAEFANKGLITYKYSNMSYSLDFTTKEFAKHGIHLKVLLHVISFFLFHYFLLGK